MMPLQSSLNLSMYLCWMGFVKEISAIRSGEAKCKCKDGRGLNEVFLEKQKSLITVNSLLKDLIIFYFSFPSMLILLLF